jgi:hypothetical protein
MIEIRCPSLRLWLCEGMGRGLRLPQECPQCHLRRPIDASARLTARIAGEHPAVSGGSAARQTAGDAPWRPPVGLGASR